MLKIILIACFCFITACSVTKQEEATHMQLDVNVRNASKVYMDPETKRSSKAMYHFLVGQLSYLDQDYLAARENFEEATNLLDPSHPKLHARLAELFIRSAELERGLKHIKLALAEDPQNPSYLLIFASLLETLGREAEAEPVYQELIEKNPDLLEPYIILANLYSERLAYDKSIEILNKLKQKRPDEAASYYYLARAYEGAEDFKKAAQYMRKAYNIKSKDGDIGSELIRIYLKQDDIPAVKRICAELLEKYPEHKIARRISGELAIGEGRYNEALEHLEILESDEEEASEVRFKMALIHLEQQNFKEAERELSLVLAKQPTNYQARYYLASILAGAGRETEAVAELMQIKKESDLFVKARTLASFLLRQQGEMGKAEQAAREAYSESPEDLQLLAYLILILRDEKKLEEAAELLEAKLDKGLKDEKLLFNYSIIKFDLGERDEALELMNEVLSMNPQNSDALNFVAYTLAEADEELERAKELIEKALELKPNDGYYLDTLGWVLYKQKEYEEAVKVLERAVSLTGGDIVILEHYGDALMKIDLLDEALEVYKNALAETEQSVVTIEEEERARDRIRKKLRKLNRKMN